VPTVYEQVKLTPAQEWWFDFRSDLNDLGRILVTAPGSPPDRLAFRDAVRRALTNPALMAEGEKTQRRCLPAPGEGAGDHPQGAERGDSRAEEADPRSRLWQLAFRLPSRRSKRAPVLIEINL
jgi:hypothetical protein